MGVNTDTDQDLSRLLSCFFPPWPTTTVLSAACFFVLFQKELKQHELQAALKSLSLLRDLADAVSLPCVFLVLSLATHAYKHVRLSTIIVTCPEIQPQVV